MASANPIGTAMVKFTKTVNKKVTASTRESPDLSLKICQNDLYSLILNATTIKIGAILASGTCDAYGANNNNVNRTKRLWKIPENGLTPPALIFVAVLAIAPVPG